MSPDEEERVRPTRRLRLALVAAAQVVVLAAPHAALSRPAPAPHDPTIVVEAEEALVGRDAMASRWDAASGGSFVHFSGPAQPPPPDGVRVAGNRLLRDAVAFVPAGFTMVALVNPEGVGETAWAARRLDDRTMDEALAWGANTIRFQLSQR